AINGGFFKSPTVLDGSLAFGNGVQWPGSPDTNYRSFFAAGRGDVMISEAGEVVTNPASWIEEAVAGDATLVSNGKANYGHGGACAVRNPETSIGYSADKSKIFFVTVDGRQSSSIGMLCSELSDYMVGLGVHHAIRLDGGGSTTMWVSGKGVVNSPSDGSERTVANHIGVFAKGEGPPRSCASRFIPPIYLSQKRHVLSPTVAQAWGLDLGDILPVSDDFLNLYGTGRPLSANPIMLKEQGGDAVYIDDHGALRHIPDLYTLVTWRFHHLDATEKPKAELETYPPGSPFAPTPVLARGSGPEVYLLDHSPPYGAAIKDMVIPTTLETGVAQMMTVTLVNFGHRGWDAGKVLLKRRDQPTEPSALCDNGWVDCVTPLALETGVAVAEEVTLSFPLFAVEPGMVRECFNLVSDTGVSFGDPEQAGPADDALCVELQVTGEPLAPDDPRRPSGGGLGADGGVSAADTAGERGEVLGGCAMGVPWVRAGRSNHGLGPIVAMACFLLVGAGRRRRRCT
ncbi:MAG: phosphodiester glycosidase family protein, partial [Myxococcales bacterium]|nr:phosphodiester glycosidase family protein [Myxococcales bacterium]